MIAIILRKPDGFGGWTDWGGFTDSDAPVTVDSVQCLPGTITDMGEISNKADFSRGMGALASPPEFQLSVADFAGSRRISAAIFDGTSRFVGWAITLYNSRTRNSGDLIRIGPVNDWRVSDVSSSGDEITFRCMAAWGLNRALIGIGDGDAQIGLCVGPHDIAVTAPAIQDPIEITRPYPNGNYEGTPGYGGEIEADLAPISAATRKQLVGAGWGFVFACRDNASALEFYGKLDGAVIAGKVFAEVHSGAFVYPAGSGSDVYVTVSEGFYLGEVPADVRMQSRSTTIPIAYGAGSFIGFATDSGTSLPLSSVTIDSTTGKVSVSPLILSPGGFLAFSDIPCRLTFAGGSDWWDSSTFYGTTKSVPTGSDATPAPLDSLVLDPVEGIALVPASGTSSSLAMQQQAENGITYSLKLRVGTDADLAKFSAFFVDTSWKFSAYAHLVDGSVKFKAPFSSAPLISLSAASGGYVYKQHTPQGQSSYSYWSRSSDLAALQSIGDYRLDYSDVGGGGIRPRFQTYFQLQSIALYGVSEVDLRSPIAILRPGSSPYAGSSTSLTAAAKSILSSMGGGTYTSAVEPDNKLAASFGGEFLEPTLTKAEAVNRIAREMWLALSPNSNGAYMIVNMDLIETPPAPLGALEDVVTEPVIEYDLVGTEYKGKAYIANVDQEFDWARYDEFCGGWGSRIEGGATVDYSLLIWQKCRDAYLRHGIKQSETFQMPGLHEAEAIGRSWYDQTRNNVRRIDWLANPPQFITLSKAEASGSYSWAGCTAIFDSFPAACAGYDVTPYAGQWTLVTDVSRDIRKHEVRMTVMLPPALSAPEIVTYIQTIDDADPVIVQSIETNSDRIMQVIQ